LSSCFNAKNNIGRKAEEGARADAVPAFNDVGGHVGTANAASAENAPNAAPPQVEKPNAETPAKEPGITCDLVFELFRHTYPVKFKEASGKENCRRQFLQECDKSENLWLKSAQLPNASTAQPPDG